MIHQALTKFAKDASGALTGFGLFLLIACLAIGGLALDVSNAYMARTHLQMTADAVAHAALYSYDVNKDHSIAKSDALALADEMAPSSRLGQVIKASNITFGNWDPSIRAFSADPTSEDAVLVDMSRASWSGNPIATHFLRFAGFGSWNLRNQSVYETYRPTCLREGFVAEDVVDIQSNNSFTNGFCIHSNTHVEVNNNGSYDPGVIVSMPDKRDIVLPTSGFNSNPGLKQALRSGSYNMRILNDLPDIIQGLEDLDPDYLPPYITGTTVLTVPRGAAETDFTPGYVHTVSCNGGQKMNFNSNVTLTDIVLVTNCKIHFAKGGTLDQSIIASTNTADGAIYAGSQFTIGRDDSCADGGGSQVLTLGGVDFSAGLQAFGGQILAMKDIEFSANANGIEGASFISYQKVSGTSNMSMGFCGSGMELNFEAKYFRMAG